MHGLILRRKHRSLVVDQEMLVGSDHHVSLPAELWVYIAEFLDQQDLSRLYMLNRPFYDIFLSRKFHNLTLLVFRSGYVKKELTLLGAMQNPLIKGKIRELHFDSQWEVNLISALDSEGWKSLFPRRSWSRYALLMSGRMKKAKCQAIKRTIQSAVSMLSNVTRLSLSLRHPMPNSLVLDALWTGCSQTLVDLTLLLTCLPRAPDHGFGLGISCPHLRSLHVTVFAYSLPYSELLNEVRSLIPEDGGCLEELSICLYGGEAPLMNTFFGHLRKLQLHGDHTGIPSILPFITPHRDTLEEITLGARVSMDLRNITLLNPSILTSLTTSIEPFLESECEIYPFLSRCTGLHTLSLSHERHLGSDSPGERTPSFVKLLPSLPPSLTHLIFPGLLLDFKVLLSILQRLPNISSLTLSDCYPANEEIRTRFCQAGSVYADWTQFPGEGWRIVFDSLQARLKVLTPEDVCESNEEAILTLFAGSMSSSRPCCSYLFGNLLLTLLIGDDPV